jgi:hypothetical protein
VGEYGKERIGLKSIRVRNRTGLTDYSALFRAALYMSGYVEEALEGGYQIKESRNRRVLTVSEAGRTWSFIATLAFQARDGGSRL